MAVVLLLVAALAAGLVGGEPGARAQTAPGPLGIELQRGPGYDARPLGGAPDSGTPGEAWGAVDLDGVGTDPGRITVDGRALSWDPDAPAPLGLVRYRPGEGWRVVDVTRDEQGRALPLTLRDGRVTAVGGLVLVADDDGGARRLLTRDPGGETRAAPAPPDTVLLPRSGSVPAETLSPSAITGRSENGRTVAFAAIAGRPQQLGIARWDGDGWTREPICARNAGGAVPPGCAAAESLPGTAFGLTVVALAAREGGGAWALARAHESAGLGLVLLERTTAGGQARWVRRPLGVPAFDARATPALGVDAVTPLDGGFALTATRDGVWVDGGFQARGVARQVTLRVTAAGTVSWCDVAGLCDHPLAIELSPRQRSYAWDGPGNGSRVVGPLASRGTAIGRYATLDGDRWRSVPTFVDPSRQLAFAEPDEGWIGPAHVTRDRPPSPLATWPLPVRRPLQALAAGPGTAGALETPALAVGENGTILRYTPGQGWDSEVLLASDGVGTANLRGVAWPSRDVAYAVGDLGTIWRWRRSTDLWEADPAAPDDFVGNLTGIAFAAGDPDRGYAVGRAGTLLRYGKSWTPVELPAAARGGGPLGGPVDLLGVAFAGPVAYAAAGRTILTDGGNGQWRVDEQATALMAKASGRRDPLATAVAGLPDGGVVVAGRGFVLERDGGDRPWRFSDQPLPGRQVPVAAAAFREGERVRALLSIAPVEQYPLATELDPGQSDPDAPPPRLGPLSTPPEAYLLRETASGWRDEDRSGLGRRSDAALALLVDGGGRGWVVGGFNGRPALGAAAVDEYETAGIFRYDPAGPALPPAVRAAGVDTPSGVARFVAGGHAICGRDCAESVPLDLSADRTLARALPLADALGDQANGPRALLYTGGYPQPTGDGSAAADGDQQRYAQLLAQARLPLLVAPGPGDVGGRTSLGFETAFGTFRAPLGQAPAPAAMRLVTLGRPAVAGRARTHYAVDQDGNGGTVRLVVIDNAGGSLAERDDRGNPAEDQAAWLRQVLADARGKAIPTVVAGSLGLNPSLPNAAADGPAVAAILRDGGASAYVYDGAGEQRQTAVPQGSGEVPAFASGTLGTRVGNDRGFGPPGLLLLELAVDRRDPRTNRAPVAARLVPVIEDLAIEAVDGRVLNRSQPALFRGLGRRPRAAGSGVQYTELPNAPCPNESCPGRIEPEVRFHSSNPDIADFVRLDPKSTNPRKPFLDPTSDKPVADSGSGLLCAFNAGRTTVTISAGGLSYATTVTVRAGSVLRPCGTVPLVDPPAPKPADPVPSAPPPGLSPAPSGASPTPTPAPPPAPPSPAPAAAPKAPLTAKPAPLPATPRPSGAFLVPLAPLAPPSPPGQPVPPAGTSSVSVNVSVPVSQPVGQVEREREEEVAHESSQAFAQVALDQPQGPGVGGGAALVALIVLAAVGGAATAGAARARRERRRRPFAYARSADPRRRP
ncbi:hypothetical protein [Patulibacter defluvii]|uniref:hypothetical protein n=1 Tax=Patulibacter defluvii TaxID=3095358 RepID=UPI002A76102C|nr:hypothetical protein [Patulibacter sp. DM4]